MLKSLSKLFVLGVEKEGELKYSLTTLGNVSLVLLIIVLIIAMVAFSGTGKKIKTKQLIFSSVAMALAMVASFIKFASLPFGGSITLFSMFFICFIGYLYGLRVGLMTAIAYGLLQFVQDPYIMHPIQVLLDYPLAFGCLGLSGIFMNSKHGLIKGFLLGAFGRYLCHVLSGYVFFSMWAPEGSNLILYSIGYNATYIVPEVIATIIILSIPALSNGLNQVKKLANQD